MHENFMTLSSGKFRTPQNPNLCLRDKAYLQVRLVLNQLLRTSMKETDMRVSSENSLENNHYIKYNYLYWV